MSVAELNKPFIELKDEIANLQKKFDDKKELNEQLDEIGERDEPFIEKVDVLERVLYCRKLTNDFVEKIFWDLKFLNEKTNLDLFLAKSLNMNEALLQFDEYKNLFKDRKQKIIKIRKSFKKHQVKVFEEEEFAICLEEIPDFDKQSFEMLSFFITNVFLNWQNVLCIEREL